MTSSATIYSPPVVTCLGTDFARVVPSDTSEGAILGSGYSFDAQDVIRKAESFGLGFDSYLAAFLHEGFHRADYRTPCTIMLSVDYIRVDIYCCSRRASFQVPFAAQFGSLLGYGLSVVPTGACPYARWQDGYFHRVHPAAVLNYTAPVRMFGGVDDYITGDRELHADVVARPTAYSWWSALNIAAPMKVRMGRKEVSIPQAIYLWAGNANS